MHRMGAQVHMDWVQMNPYAPWQHHCQGLLSWTREISRIMLAVQLIHSVAKAKLKVSLQPNTGSNDTNILYYYNIAQLTMTVGLP